MLCQVRSMRDVVCINLTIANAAAYAESASPTEFARLYFDVQSVCTQIISLEFQPFGVVQENNTHSLTVVVNAPFMRSRSRFATFSLYMATRLRLAANQV